jgi:hypothetical protein
MSPHSLLDHYHLVWTCILHIQARRMMMKMKGFFRALIMIDQSTVCYILEGSNFQLPLQEPVILLNLFRALFSHAVSYLSQVLALVSYPVLLDDPRFPTDAKARAKDILSGCRGGSVGKSLQQSCTPELRCLYCRLSSRLAEYSTIRSCYLRMLIPKLCRLRTQAIQRVFQNNFSNSEFQLDCQHKYSESSTHHFCRGSWKGTIDKGKL